MHVDHTGLFQQHQRNGLMPHDAGADGNFYGTTFQGGSSVGLFKAAAAVWGRFSK